MHHTTILLLGDCTYLTYRRDMFFALNENMWFQSHLPLHLVENEGFLSSKIEHTKRRWFCKFPNMGICPLPAPQFELSRLNPIWSYRAITTFWKMMLFQRIAKLQIFAISRLWSNKLQNYRSEWTSGGTLLHFMHEYDEWWTFCVWDSWSTK